jgi:hypothetical protein
MAHRPRASQIETRTARLTFWQAQDRARKPARGSDADAGRPATVADAVAAYERDLIARGGSVANAGRIRKHLTPTLAAKPAGLLTARELAAWRDGLLAGGMKSATAVRLAKATKAALNLAARRDPRILNRAAWRDGLGGLAETTRRATCSASMTVRFAPSLAPLTRSTGLLAYTSRPRR